ncbi:MAG: hypothetical protein ISS78_04615 [Phycisphaerae bacterium]|nr:hypothetical protein [Phycisphaerae bacterium]
MKWPKITAWQLCHVDAAGVAVCALLALLGYLVGIRPLVQRRENLVARETRLNVQKSDAQKLSGSASLVKERLARVRQALAASPVQLESAQYVNRRIARLAGLASDCAAKIDEIQPGEPAAAVRYRMVPIRLAGSGSFPACVRLLHRLQEVFPDTAVASFQLTGRPSEQAAPAVFRIDLIWYASANPQPPKD